MDVSKTIVDAAEILDGAVTPSKLSPHNNVISSSSGNYTLASSTPTDVTNLAVNITKSNRPVEIELVPEGGSGNISKVGPSVGAYNGAFNQFFYILRDSTVIAYFSISGNGYSGSGTNWLINVPPGVIRYVDRDASSGSYTYKIQTFTDGPSVTGRVSYCKLLVREL